MGHREGSFLRTFGSRKLKPPVQWVCEELTRGKGGAIETLCLYARTVERVNRKSARSIGRLDGEAGGLRQEVVAFGKTSSARCGGAVV